MGRYRRYLIGLAIVLLLVAAYAAAGFLAVPYFARRYAQDFVRTHYGRTIRIGEMHFNPFTLDLDVSRVALPDADGQTLLSFARLQVDLQFATLWRLGPSFGEIILTQPYARVVIRPNGVVNLADLGKGFPPPPPGPQKKPAPMRLYIHRLAVVSGTASFEDRSHATPFRADFTPIAFELHDFSTTAATGDEYGLSVSSPEGGRLLWSGTVHLAPLSSLGRFEVTDLKARTIWSYLRQSLPFEIDSGTIGIKGTYDLAGGGGPTGLMVDVQSIVVKGLGVKPKGGAQRYIDVAGVEVDDTRVDLTRHTVRIAKLALSGGDIKAWLDEQRKLNLLELLAPPAASAAAAAGDAGSTPPKAAPAAAASLPSAPPSGGSHGTGAAAWSIAVPDISASGFRLSVEDRGVAPAAALLLSPLHVHVGGFDTSPDDTLDVTLDSGINASGQLSARAKLTPKSGALSGHAEMQKLDLTALQPYVSHYTSMTLQKGTLGGKFDFERQADGALAASGTTYIGELRTVDNALKMDFIRWKDLRIADIRYRSSPAGLRVGSITALEPYVRMIIAPDRALNIKEILTPPGAAARKTSADAHESTGAAPADAGTSPDTGKGEDTGNDENAGKGEAAGAAPQVAADRPRPHTRRSARGHQEAAQTAAAPAGPLTPFPVSIGTVTLVNGSANYADLWIKPSFAIGIQTLGGTVSGLSSDPRSRAKVDLKGKIDRYSPIEITGEANLLSAALYTDMKMRFQDLDLTVVNPYSGHFVGYKIAKGKLSVEVSYKIEQRKLTAAQHFVVDQLELGERVDSPDAVHVPLKIAVALLKDRNGVIDLNLPMSGSLDDPKFRIGPILWKMFVNLIVKAASAPFALLGHLFGGGEHVNIIAFDAGSAELDKPARDQLAAIAKSLQERPQLKLEVPIVYSPSIDRPQIAATRLRAELLAREQNTREGRKHPDTAGELALADPAKHFKLLVEQYQADLGKDTPLPPSAVAVQQAKRNALPPYDPAINDLGAALIDHIQVPDSDLEALGKERAKAIQGALVSDGQVEAARVFIVQAKPESAASQVSAASQETASAQPAAAQAPAAPQGEGSPQQTSAPQANTPAEARSDGQSGAVPPASSAPQSDGRVKVELAVK